MGKAILMKVDGASFFVETDQSVEMPPGSAGRPRGNLPGVAPGMDAVAGVGELGREFAEVENVIVTCCSSLYEALHRVPRAERVVVEFGVKLGGEAGVPLLTKATGEANFKVLVEWKPPPQG